MAVRRVARNLYVQTIGNSRTWLFRYQINGRQRSMGLGSLDIVPLAVAKRKALEFRAMLADGKDPLDERGRASRRNVPTFRDHAPSWRSAKSEQQWTNTLAAYAYPVIGRKPINAIRPDDVLAVLRPIWTKKPETATRVRGRIERIWSRAKSLGHCSGDDPADWQTLRHSLPSPRQTKRVKHHEAIAVERIPAFTERLKQRDSTSCRALLFTLLTAVRTSETRLAEWPEIDLDSAIWTIPAAKMKAARPHRVPLAPAVLALLRGLPRNGALVFPSKSGAPLSVMAMLEAMRDLVPGATVHGLRSSFRDWCARSGYSAELAEKCLAHVVKGKAAAAYQRDDLIEQRRPLMAAWSQYCLGGEVVQETPPRKEGATPPAEGIIDLVFGVRRMVQRIQRRAEAEKDSES